MQFGGLVKQSLVDYPGEIAAVLFTRGCNLRCPYCQNAHLLTRPGSVVPEGSVPREEIMAFLEEHKNFLDAVVISGGEPTLQAALTDFVAEIKHMGYLVKLDTNGSSPLVLDRLIRDQLLDYVAMDIKAPLEFKAYQRACGKLSPEEFLNIRNSLLMLQGAPVRVEFRTTVLPVLHRPEDILAIARCINGAWLYTLQQFNPEFTLDPAYATEAPYDKEEMQKLAQVAAPYVQQVRVLNL